MKKLNKYASTELIYFAAGLLVMFLLMKGCSTAPETVKTKYIKGKETRDTTYVYDTIKVPHPVPYAVTRYVQAVSDSVRSNPCDSVRSYRSGVDSAGIRIDVTDQVRGVLLSQEISYRLPTVNTHRVDTVREVTVRNYRYGIGVLYDGTSPTIIGQYGVTRNAAVYGGYNLTTGKVSIGAGVRF